MSSLFLLFVLTFVFCIGLSVFTLFVSSFMECTMLVMVWHLPVEGAMTTLIRKCSILDDFYICYCHLFCIPLFKNLAYIPCLQKMLLIFLIVGVAVRAIYSHALWPPRICFRRQRWSPILGMALSDVLTLHSIVHFAFNSKLMLYRASTLTWTKCIIWL